MEYKNEKLSARFVIPDVITVRQQLAYISTTAYTNVADRLEGSWRAAKELITEWHCDLMPDIDVKLETISNPKVSDVVIWASLTVKNHINALDDIPKNS
jgi:hypothetical protein